MTNIYIGNLPRQATEEQIKAAFAAYGDVASVAIIMDRVTGESRGFGFVEMPNDTEAQSAIGGLNGSELGGRVINVNVAKPRREGRGGERRGGGRRGGGGGGGSRRW